MKKLDHETQVGELVSERPSLSRVMERYGIDYCCGGHLSLASACQLKKLNVESVLAEIARAMDGPPERNLESLSLVELVDHIVSLHHGFLRDTLPVLSRQLDRVVTVHGPRHPELAKTQNVFRIFAAEMYQHMDKEEQILFPLICRIEANANDESACSLSQIIQVMESEHEGAGNDLASMRDLTHGYAVPEGACGTYRAVLQGLADLEEDTHLHVHSENHVLFPKALQRLAHA